MDLRNVGIYHSTTRLHNPEDLDLKHHRRESLNTRIRFFKVSLSLKQTKTGTILSNRPQLLPSVSLPVWYS